MRRPAEPSATALEYAKLKNVELESLLKERSLPHTGKKADLIARLQEDDKRKKEAAPAPKSATANTTTTVGSAAVASTNDDEIDWDDDPTETSKPIPVPRHQLNAPHPVEHTSSNEKKQTESGGLVTEAAATKEEAVTVKTTAQANGSAATEVAEETKAEEKAAGSDFNRGLAEATIEVELEKRRARAKKFGLPDGDQEALKALERAKRFGQESKPLGLNEALPERIVRKRGREHEDDGTRSTLNPRNTRQGGGRGRDHGRDHSGRVAQSQPHAAKSWLKDAEKAKAEARRSRFGGS